MVYAVRRIPARIGLILAAFLVAGAAAPAPSPGRVIEVLDDLTVTARLPAGTVAKVGDKYEIYDLAADGYKLVVAHAEVDKAPAGKVMPANTVRLHLIYVEASYKPQNLRGAYVEPDESPA